MWVPMTAVGSVYEVEINSETGLIRHRPRPLPGDDFHVADWTPGRPPDGPHSTAPPQQGAGGC